MESNSNGNLIIFIVAVTAIIVLTLFFNRRQRKSIPNPPPLKEGISEDVEYAAPISEPEDELYTYVYYPDEGVYLIPYYDLDWSIPYHRWMYLHYPNFYYDYYGIPVVYDVDYHYNHWWNCRHGLCDWPWQSWWWPWWGSTSGGTTFNQPLPIKPGKGHRLPSPKTGTKGYTASPRKHPLSVKSSPKSTTIPKTIPKSSPKSIKSLLNSPAYIPSPKSVTTSRMGASPKTSRTYPGIPTRSSPGKSGRTSLERFMKLDQKTGACKYTILDPAAYDEIPAYAKADQENFIQLNPKTGDCDYVILDPSGYDDVNAFANADPKKDLLLGQE